MGMEVWAERVARSWESGVVEGEGIGMLYLFVSFDVLQGGRRELRSGDVGVIGLGIV